jgi:16S rRNA (guanine966-N2)-methyltransferase
VRVIAGTLLGRRLEAPPGRATRPTEDRVRTSLFDLLGPVPEGARVLDLFAGTGALAIEALSRGAGSAVLVERDAAAIRALRKNVETLGLVARVRVLASDALTAPVRGDGPFDFVFLDPPYGSDLAERALPLAVGLLARGGIAALEDDARKDPLPTPEGTTEWKSRRYGDTRITLYRKENA